MQALRALSRSIPIKEVFSSGLKDLINKNNALNIAFALNAEVILTF